MMTLSVTVAADHQFLECDGGASTATITISVQNATWPMNMTESTCLRE